MQGEKIMSQILPPNSLKSLEKRISNDAGGQPISTARNTKTVAMVALSQMMPPGAIKGGTAMKIRLGDRGRFSLDIDVARAQAEAEFETTLAENLEKGWGGFTGTMSRNKSAAVPVLATKHQIAQKIHGASNQVHHRPHDLVDLQLLITHETVDLAEVREICERLFPFRKRQSWPPVVTMSGPELDSLYLTASEDISVLPDLLEAVAWANSLIATIVKS